MLLDHRRKEDGERRIIGMMQWEDVVFVAGRVIKEVEQYVGRLGEKDGATDDGMYFLPLFLFLSLFCSV